MDSFQGLLSSAGLVVVGGGGMTHTHIGQPSQGVSVQGVSSLILGGGGVVSHVPSHGLSHGQPFQPMAGGGGSGTSQGHITGTSQGHILNPLQQYPATPANAQGLPSLISSATGGGRDGGGGGMGAGPFVNQSATQSMRYVSGWNPRLFGGA
jgi:hypothetical protein